MKTVWLVLFALLVPASGAFARCGDATAHVSSTCCDPPARWAPRHDPRDAEMAITTEDGDATLLLTREVTAIQLSDRALHKIQRKLKAEQDQDEDNVLGNAIKTAVLSSVRALLDHSAEVPVRKLRSVEYRDGRLVFTTESGKRIFDDVDVNDRDVMESFSERDALAFVREFRRVKAASEGRR
jgi:hypothetical protein